MKLKNYEEWSKINEEGATDELGKLPLLVKDFILNVIRTPGPPYFVYTDWWCVPDAKMLNDAVGTHGAPSFAAEKFESQQRRLPSEEKLLNDYFLIEFEFRDNENTHSYIISGIDTREKDLIFPLLMMIRIPQKVEAIKVAFTKSLQKNFPTHYTSRKFGL
jgi:hypothetical protein